MSEKNQLPAGIWDNPDPQDMTVYNEFVESWFADSANQESFQTVSALTYDGCTAVGLSVNTIGTYPYVSTVTVTGGTNPNSGTWQFKIDVSGTISTATLNWNDSAATIKTKVENSFDAVSHSWSSVSVTGTIDAGEVVINHDVFYDSVTVVSSLEYCETATVFDFVGSGDINYSGAATANTTFDFVGSGNINYSGAATATATEIDYTYPLNLKNQIRGDGNSAHWTFANNQWLDSSGNEKHLTANGTPTFDDGVTISNLGGRGHGYSNSTSYWSTTEINSYAGDNWTLSFYFALAEFNNLDFIAAGPYFWFWKSVDGVFELRNPISDVVLNVGASVGEPTIGEWYHVIISWSHSAGKLSLHWNGSPVGETPTGSQGAQTEGISFISGVAGAVQEASFLSGYLFDSTDISNTYNSGNGVQWNYGVPSAIGAGGIVFSGESTAGFTPTFNANGSGNINYSGAATTDLILSANGSGGIVFDGETTPTYSTDYNAVGSGNINFGFGAAVSSANVYNPLVGGNINYSGVATADFTNDYFATGSGTISYGGDAEEIKAFSPVVGGTISYSGNSTAVQSWNAIGEGTIDYSGLAITTVAYNVTSGATVFFNGFQYRKRIEISLPTLSGFPAYITTTVDSEKVQANGFDFAFYDQNENLLPFYVENYNTDTGVVDAFVKVDSTAGINQVVYLYYGKTVGTNPNTEATFSNYNNVYHLSESGNGTANEFVDSAGSLNGRGGNGLTSAVPEQTANGKYGKANLFGSNSYIGTGSDGIVATSDYSVSLWVYPVDSTYIVKRTAFSRGKQDAPNGKGWALELGQLSNGRPYAAIQSNLGVTVSASGLSALTKNNWHHLAAVWDSGTSLKLFVNGALTTTTTTAITTLANATIGNQIGRRDNTYYYNGRIDEVRTTASALSADWLAAEYNTNIVIGSEQTAINYSGQAGFSTNYNTIIGTGGITFAGDATTIESNVYGATGAGVISFVGSAGADLSLGLISTGVQSFSGAALYSFAFNHNSTGGLTFGGTNTNSPSLSAIGAGVVTFSGSATTKRDYTTEVTGSISYSGNSTVDLSLSAVASGGVVFGGDESTAVTTIGTVADGGLTFSGAATSYNNWNVLGAGVLAYSGSATTSEVNEYSFSGSGGIAFSGTNLNAPSLSAIGSGSVSFSGSATTTEDNSAIVDGGITYAGSATYAPAISRSSTGVLTFDGDSISDHTRNLYSTGSGNIEYSGQSAVNPSYDPTSTGSIVFSGNALFHQWQGRGGIVFTGTPELTNSYNFAGSGNLRFAYVETIGGIDGYITLPAIISGNITLPAEIAGEITM